MTELLGKNQKPLPHEEADDDDDSDTIDVKASTPAPAVIHSSRNKAAVAYQGLQKNQEPSSESKISGNSCPARKLFYSNEGDIQVSILNP